MPLNLPITAAARQETDERKPTGLFYPETGQVVHKPLDGTDIAGMQAPALDAIEKLEILIRELQVQVAGLERRVK